MHYRARSLYLSDADSCWYVRAIAMEFVRVYRRTAFTLIKLLVVIAIILAPLVHRFLHKFLVKDKLIPKEKLNVLYHSLYHAHTYNKF